MAWTDFTDEQITELPDEMLVLGEAHVRRMPQYDTKEGRDTLFRFSGEITRRGLDTSAVVRNLLEEVNENLAVKAEGN